MAFADWSWVIGLLIYMVGRSTMALGANLQRYSMRIEKQKPPEERRAKRKQPMLIGGVVLYTGSGLFLSVALVFASPTLLAPCGTIIFASNTFFAWWLNDEPFYWMSDGGCILLIVAGTVMVVISAPKNNQSFTNEELINMCSEVSFIAFVSGALVLIIVTYFLPRYMLGGCFFLPDSEAAEDEEQEDTSKVEPDAGGADGAGSEKAPEYEPPEIGVHLNALATPTPNDSSPSKATGAGTTMGIEEESCANTYSEYVDSSPAPEKKAPAEEDAIEWPDRCVCCSYGTREFVTHLCYGTLAGALGGLNITFTKSIFSLIGGELDDKGILAIFTSWLLWTIGVVLGGCFVLQMMATTTGLERSPAMIFVPCQSVTEEGMAVLGGLFYFQDFKKFDTTTSIIFMSGEGLSILAVLLLTKFQLSRGTSSILPPDIDGETSLPTPS